MEAWGSAYLPMQSLRGCACTVLRSGTTHPVVCMQLPDQQPHEKPPPVRVALCPPSALAGPCTDIQDLIPNLHLSAFSFSSRCSRLMLRELQPQSSPQQQFSSQYIDAIWVNSCETPVPEKPPFSPQMALLHYTFFISIASLNESS